MNKNDSFIFTKISLNIFNQLYAKQKSTLNATTLLLLCIIPHVFKKTHNEEKQCTFMICFRQLWPLYTEQ